MSTSISEFIELALDNGKSIPLRHTVSKHGNAYWAVLNRRKDGSRYDNGYGVNVNASVLGDELPTSGTILGEHVSFEKDTTDKGQTRLRGKAELAVPGHGKKEFSFRITVVDAESKLYNISASVHGKRGQGGPQVLSEL